MTLSTLALLARVAGTVLLLVLVYQGSRVALVLVLALLCVAAETQAVLWRRLMGALEGADRWRIRALQALAATKEP